MIKEALRSLVEDRLAELRQKRAGVPQGDLMTVYQFVRSSLAEKYSFPQIGDSDQTLSGEGSAKDALARLKGRATDRRIVDEIVRVGASPNLMGDKDALLQYKNDVKMVLDSLKG